MKYVGVILVLIILLGIFGIVLSRKTSPFSVVPSTVSNNSESSPNSANDFKISSGNVPSIPLKLGAGFVIHVFVEGISGARDLEFSPGGTLLVSSPGNGEVFALADKDGDGVADSKKVIIQGENRPHGLAFFEGKLFVAEVTQVVRYNWDESNLTATKDKVLFNLPENSNHNSRTIVFDKSGRMYVSVGSTCNVCNEGAEFSSAIVVSDKDGNDPRVFAKGIRNAPFLEINPNSGEVWSTGMGRDNLGDNIPPDEINIIREGRDFGWPNCYGNRVPDLSFNEGEPSFSNRNANCQNTEPPIFEIPAHSAPLGLTFIHSSQFPSDWQGDLLVSLHGSWNRSTPIGYKVVHLKVDGNRVTGSEDFLTGFISASAIVGSEAKGRPVDLTFDTKGNLYLSDDKLGSVYIIQKM